MIVMRKTLYAFALFLLINVLDAQTPGNKEQPEYKLRKCCTEDSYYNLRSQRCLPTINTKSFLNLVKARVMTVNVPSFNIKTGRLLKCRETEECFETITIPDKLSHTLLPNGFLYEHAFGGTFNRENYCLETVGNDPSNVTLAVAFCLPDEKQLPKCCPDNQYFDANLLDCFPYSNLTDSVQGNIIQTKLKLRYRNDLHCALAFPQQFTFLSQAYLNRCRDICLNDRTQCYSKRKFCLDNVFTTKFQISAFVCVDHVTKLCCRDDFYDENNIDCKCHGNRDSF